MPNINKRYKREPRYISRITVRVSSISCVEMMRYDSCWPATEEDARKLERLARDMADTADDHVIVFFRAGKTETVTDERWRSFGCEVLAVQNPDHEPFKVVT